MAKERYILTNGYKAHRVELMEDRDGKLFLYGMDLKDYAGNPKDRIYVDHIEQVSRKSSKSSKKDISKMVAINVEHETAKAYAIFDGSNGLIGNHREYYRYVAKSICAVENGIVYAPKWAIRGCHINAIRK